MEGLSRKRRSTGDYERKSGHIIFNNGSSVVVNIDSVLRGAKRVSTIVKW